jgi:chromosome segregation protein
VSRQEREWKTFQHGSAWVRADFHMHTKADKEFTYEGDDNDYARLYVEGLKKAGIQVAVITNHNKFNKDEFKRLRKRARGEEIFLLPGIELSIGDGANGIHTLVIFSEEWLADGKAFINPFLTSTFAGKTPCEYERENGRSSQSLTETVKTLDGYEKDYFLIFAHVEQSSGLWKELNGGRLTELAQNEALMDRTLGFQKVRTRDDRQKVQGWWGNRYPAEVEGCDCKSISEIGKGGHQTYIKIGDYSFSAVKLALQDFNNRVSETRPTRNHSRILSATYLGGKMDEETIYFSEDLNTLIGIRGSGKSSILESIRFALDISFGDEAADLEYKRNIIPNLLGSGGKITVELLNRHNRRCRIERLVNASPDIFVDGKREPGISITETCLHKPIYFGQKDLSNTQPGFERDLVEKLVGPELKDVRERIEVQKRKVETALAKLSELDDQVERKEEWEAKKRTAEHQLETYRAHGLEQKLADQVDFEQDLRKCRDISQDLTAFISDLETVSARHEDKLRNHRLYKSRVNTDFFEEYFQAYDETLKTFDQLSVLAEKLKTSANHLSAKRKELEERRDSLKEQFAAVERTIAKELQSPDTPTLTTEEFKKLRQTVDSAGKILAELTATEKTRTERQSQLFAELAELRVLRQEEYRKLQAALHEVGERSEALKIEVDYQGDKQAFAGLMRDLFRGNNLRKMHFESLVEKYSDPEEIYKDLKNAKLLIGNMGETFESCFLQNLSQLLTYKVPDEIKILYHGKKLKDHSLGQRASALILFILNSSDSDLVIIDQPEDDLDNQTIYEDVIKLMKDMKEKTQFVIATHNPNFPVLGDAEQVISCSYSSDDDVERIKVSAGSIDKKSIQNDIVNIMEGGEEAFQRRGRFYQRWKPQNSTK